MVSCFYFSRACFTELLQLGFSKGTLTPDFYQQICPSYLPALEMSGKQQDKLLDLKLLGLKLSLKKILE